MISAVSVLLAAGACAAATVTIDPLSLVCDGGAIERLGAGYSATTTQTGRPARFAVPLPRPGGTDAAFVRIRVDENLYACRHLSVSAKGARLMDFVAVKPGLWTIPYASFQRTANDADSCRLELGLTGAQAFAGLRFSGIEAVSWSEPNSVRLRAHRADGREVAYGETLGKGDVLTVEMPLKDRADSLTLSFFRVGHRSVRSVWDSERYGLAHLDLPGAVTRLEPSAETSLVYRASVRLTGSAETLRLDRGRFVAAVHYYGADSHDNGIFYGVSPFALALDADPEAARADVAVRLLDFGPSESEVMTGARAVTEREVPDGFRWIRRPNEFAQTRIRQFDALTHDWAAACGTAEMSFALKLPRGHYSVAAGFGAVGLSCFLNGRYQPSGVEVSVDGRKVFERIPGNRRDELFRLMDRDARIDEDVYETYAKPLLTDARFELESTGGEVTFTVRAPAGASGVALDYLCLWPAGDAAGERKVRSILDGRRTRFEAYWNFMPRAPLDVEPPNAIRPEDLPSEPLALIARESPQEFVYPDSLPHVAEIGQPLRGAAAPGERYDHAVMLCANADLDRVELTAEGFPAGLRAKCLRAMTYRSAHNLSRTMRIGLNHLLPGPRDVRKGTRSCWYVQFDVAPDCAPGVYCGEIVAKARSGETARLPASLEVWPITLPELADHRIAENGGGDGTPPHLRAGRELLGCNTFTPMLHFTENTIDFTRGANGRINGVTRLGGLTLPELSGRFRMAKEMGYDFPAPYVSLMPMAHRAPFKMGKLEPHTPDYVDAIRVAYSTLVAVARSNGYETVTLDLGGEMGYGDNYPPEKTLEEAVWLFRTIKAEVPKILLSYRCNCKATVERFYPVLDVVGVRGPKSWNAADALSDFGRNKPVYSYSVGGRYQNGISSWYHGAKGNYREWLGIVHHLEFNDFVCEGSCGGSVHCELVMGPDGEWLPTVRGEAWRAAIDDRRYLRLLEESVRVAKDGPMRDHARAFLVLLRDNLRATRRDERHPHIVGAYREDGNLAWPCLRLDIVREICVMLTLALRGDRADTLPSFMVTEGDNPLNFALDDGPLNRPGQKGITGRFEVKIGSPEETATAEVRVIRDEKVVRVVPVGPSSLKYVPRGAGLSPRRHFMFDADGLNAGAYRVELYLDGVCRARQPLVLVDGRGVTP